MTERVRLTSLSNHLADLGERFFFEQTLVDVSIMMFVRRSTAVMKVSGSVIISGNGQVFMEFEKVAVQSSSFSSVKVRPRG